MMPIRLDLLMDQRKLPTLLVECANSSMPIEVRRIRIHQNGAKPIDLASLQASPRGMGAALPSATLSGSQPGEQSAFGNMIALSGPIAPLAGQPSGGQSDSQEVSPYDIPIEIQGIIYIYNPPDKQKLGTGSEAEKGKQLEAQSEKAVDASAPGASPTRPEPKGQPPAAAKTTSAATTSKEPAGNRTTPADSAKAKDSVPAKPAPVKSGDRP
jgi:hypothetical protein